MNKWKQPRLWIPYLTWLGWEMFPYIIYKRMKKHYDWLFNHRLNMIDSSVSSLNHVRLFATLWTEACQASLSPTPRACSNSCPLSQWCHPTISSFVIPFSSCLQSFPESRTFPRSRLFESGGQNIEVSASVSVLSWIFRTFFL